MPATAASAAPMTKVCEIVRSTLTPQQAGHLQVLLAGALGPAERGAGDQQREAVIRTRVSTMTKIWV